MSHSPDHPISRSPDLPIGRSPDLLYAIIDPAQSQGRAPEEVAEALLAAGVRWIQLRDKRASSGELYASALRVGNVVRRAGGVFIVNDRADVARAAKADGVHLGQDDLPVEAARAFVGPHKIVGFSTHNLKQLREADRSSADYLAFGPIFATTTKEKPDPVVGIKGLAAARQATHKPLVAIGGITLATAREALAAGADSVAVIRDLIGAPDVHARAKEFMLKLGVTG